MRGFSVSAVLFFISAHLKTHLNFAALSCQLFSLTFSNSLIIHLNLHRFLRFYFSVLASVLDISNTQHSVWPRLQTPRSLSKYSAIRVIFSTLFSVFGMWSNTVFRVWYITFSNLLIIHAALTQPEHLILVRWISLETQWKTSWKHGRVWNDFKHGCKFS